MAMKMSESTGSHSGIFSMAMLIYTCPSHIAMHGGSHYQQYVVEGGRGVI